MERLQLSLLIMFSFSFFFTCGKHKIKEFETTKIMNSPAVQQDPDAGYTDTVSGTRPAFYSSWLTLPFSGSGSNWMANINVPEITGDSLDKKRVMVYFKTGDIIRELNYEDGDDRMYQAVEPDKISIYANFYPDTLQFRYVIFADGTFVKHDKSAWNNYAIVN
jgi:hypothetical protein